MTKKKKKKKIIFDNNFLKLYNFLNYKNYNKIIILLDKNIKNNCLNLLYKYIPVLENKSKLIEIKAGEKYKNFNILKKIFKIFLKYKIQKSDLLINFGGGVITDLGGFAGSLFKRGIDFINIPTTLLGMVDASIGGKNGINFYKLKNGIGVIKNPKYIFINYNFIKTLPIKELYSGFGEIIKYGLIYSKNLWNKIKNINLNNKNLNLEKIIHDSIKIKNLIVKKDPCEKRGIRKILNFGHTIGHAIESLYMNSKQTISHGHAISIGMVYEAWLSKKKNNLSNEEFIEICNVILKFYKFKKISLLNIKKIIKYIKNDKKNINNKIYFSLLKKIGLCTYNNKVSIKEIIKCLKEISKIY
ncbi:MAG: 3-dehydroquinate synthase [Candidatus Shikimatogenerans sp. JK-2022]|nr:3-dehydroquinate synthase [Candidatus Shikimatogenerans bostrichidophilus]